MQKIQKAVSPLAGKECRSGLFQVDRFIETPRIENTQSNYAIIALYTPNPRHSFHSQRPDTRSGKKNPTHRCPEQTVSKRPVYALEILGERFDTGDKMGFLKATIRFDLKHPEIGPEFRRFLSGVMAWGNLGIEIPASRRMTMPLDRIAFALEVGHDHTPPHNQAACNPGRRRKEDACRSVRTSRPNAHRFDKKHGTSPSPFKE